MSVIRPKLVPKVIAEVSLVLSETKSASLSAEGYSV
jgi:hypothetical protein